MKKCLEILSFYTYMCTLNEDYMIYDSWNIRCNRQKFSSFWANFFPFSPLTTWKIKISTLKKTPADNIILHRCNINNNHMVYGSWDTKGDRQIFLSFWTVFCLFTPLTNQKKSKFWKSEKTPGDIITLHLFTINNNQMTYGSWDMECEGYNFLSFWTVFCPFTHVTPNNPKN